MYRNHDSGKKTYRTYLFLPDVISTVPSKPFFRQTLNMTVGKPKIYFDSRYFGTIFTQLLTTLSDLNDAQMWLKKSVAQNSIGTHKKVFERFQCLHERAFFFMIKSLSNWFLTHMDHRGILGKSILYIPHSNFMELVSNRTFIHSDTLNHTFNLLSMHRDFILYSAIWVREYAIIIYI